ncbi:MAG: UDP-3-O-(3-hydroxymyristoyl)glucosamine N-acyltransferase [Saprospiraceae bacterium]|jgi:UDP-3-O-[3-hydroxymyristoyl] glucosamine N-acyltransferase
MAMTLEDIAKQIGGVVRGDGKIEINGASDINSAQEGEITFLSNDRYLDKARQTNASAILLSNQWKDIDFDVPTIAVDNVYESLAVILGIFGDSMPSKAEKHELSSISKSAQVDETATVGAFSVIETNARIGKKCTIHSQVYIGPDVRIGDNCIIYPGVKIYKDCLVGDNCIIHANAVIGSDGFGFAPLKDGSFKKIPQIGNVILEDDVEVGANTVIDRATMGSTVIRKGVKLDNLIQIAHNVEIGKNTVMAAQSGVAGSTKLGSSCQVGGQAGLVGHISVGDRTLIQAKSGMTKSVIEEGTKWYGYPAIDYNNYLKSFAIYKNLPDLQSRLDKLEKLFEDLRDRSE